MTRTTNAAPRTNSSSTAQSSRSKKSAGTDSVDVKQRKGQNEPPRLFNSKNDLDVDFSLKGHTVVRVDEVEVEETSEGSGRHPPIRDTSTTQPLPQVQLVDLLVPPRKSQKGKDGDFEVVPHIRPVIVLDDNATPDLDADEPWEHVSVTEEHPVNVNVLSYAKVASLT